METERHMMKRAGPYHKRGEVRFQDIDVGKFQDDVLQQASSQPGMEQELDVLEGCFQRVHVCVRGNR